MPGKQCTKHEDRGELPGLRHRIAIRALLALRKMACKFPVFAKTSAWGLKTCGCQMTLVSFQWRRQAFLYRAWQGASRSQHDAIEKFQSQRGFNSLLSPFFFWQVSAARAILVLESPGCLYA